MRRRLAAGGDDGFTLIELLVVILIIGILAAIAIPSFLNQRQKGSDASAESDARNLLTMVESCYLDTNAYDQCTTAAQVGDTSLSWGTGPGQVMVMVNPVGPSMPGVATLAQSTSGTMFGYFKLDVDHSVHRVCIVPTNVYPTGSCKPSTEFPGYGTWAS